MLHVPYIAEILYRPDLVGSIIAQLLRLENLVIVLVLRGGNGLTDHGPALWSFCNPT